MSTTRRDVHIDALPVQVYRALLDPEVIARYRVPAGLQGTVHQFEPWEGGTFRISLSGEALHGTGKSTAHTDTYVGLFEQLTPNERVVERLRFETATPGMQGDMRITTTLTPEAGGTRLTVLHEGVPQGIDPADNEAGWREALDRLAALLAPLR